MVDLTQRTGRVLLGRIDCVGLFAVELCRFCALFLAEKVGFVLGVMVVSVSFMLALID